MKHLKLLITAFAVTVFALMTACGGGENTNTNQTSADRSASSSHSAEEVDVRIADFLANDPYRNPGDYQGLECEWPEPDPCQNLPTGWHHPDGTQDIITDRYGPGTPPLGVGSFNFPITDKSQQVSIRYQNQDTVGLRLDKLKELSIWTYTESGSKQLAPTVQIPFDPDVTDDTHGWFGRLVFDHSRHTGGQTVQFDTWQKWDVLNDEKGYATMAGLLPGSSSPQGNSGHYTIDEILDKYPNAGFNSTYGSLVITAGSGWSSYSGGVDKLHFSFERQGEDFNKVFDFEPAVPQTKDDCKQGGWQNYGDLFKNQGDCISFVNHNDGQGADDQNAGPGNSGGPGNGNGQGNGPGNNPGNGNGPGN